jgi:hypothetical protein
VSAHSLLVAVAGRGEAAEALAGGTLEEIRDARTRGLATWAAATRTPGDELVRNPPFSEREAPEIIGTAVGFHYINRVVEVFQGHAPMNLGPAPLRGVARSLVRGIGSRNAPAPPTRRRSRARPRA